MMVFTPIFIFTNLISGIPSEQSYVVLCTTRNFWLRGMQNRRWVECNDKEGSERSERLLSA